MAMRGPNENRSPQRGNIRGAKEPPAAVAIVGHPVLAKAGLAAAADGTLLLAESFGFKLAIDRACRQTAVREELLAVLADEWSNPVALRAALQPTHAATASALGGGDSVKDSLVRLLLQCVSIQTDLARLLIQELANHQDELDGSAPPHVGMPLVKLVLSQFRWLEQVVDGSALLETIGELLEMADAPLRRELVLVLPDVVVDGQHAEAVQACDRAPSFLCPCHHAHSISRRHL